MRTLPDDPPPFLGTWNRVYAAVLIYLALLIVGLYVFTRVFEP
jgi:hypothetical protein